MNVQLAQAARNDENQCDASLTLCTEESICHRRWEPNGVHAVGGVLYLSFLYEILALRHISLYLLRFKFFCQTNISAHALGDGMFLLKAQEANGNKHKPMESTTNKNISQLYKGGFLGSR